MEIRLVGGLFLLYLGIKILLTPICEKSRAGKPDKSPWHACATSYVLTLANPITILSFIAIFAGLGLGTGNADYIQAILLVIGITLGSALWWLLLSGGVALILHHRITPNTMRTINWLSSIIILMFAWFSLKEVI
jgi:threonine/homoserine/homoserine lactone efflux protein